MPLVSIYELLFKVNVVPDTDGEVKSKDGKAVKSKSSSDDCCDDFSGTKELLDEFATAMESGSLPGVKTTKR